MRLPTVTSICESLLNTQERLRTIKNIAPITDTHGMPRFHISSDTIDFEVTIDDRCYLLRVPMAWDERHRLEAGAEAIRTLSPDIYFLPRCSFLNNELITFDMQETMTRNDVILEQLPEGTPFSAFLRTNLDPTGHKAIRKFLLSLGDVYPILEEKSIIHGRIKPENILIDKSFRPVFLRYLHTKPRSTANDFLAILHIAVMTYISACEPSLHIWFSNRTRNDIRPLLDDIQTQAEFIKADELTSIIKVLKSNSPLAPESAAAALRHIASLPFTPMPLLVSLVSTRHNPKAPNIAKDVRSSYDSGEDLTLKIDFTSCNYIGALSDTLIKYCIDNHWGYTDRHGNRIIEPRFCVAGDFYEGRSAVAENGKYGLIDREGQYIIDPICESLEWYGEDNIASAALDGKWYLFDRTGRVVTHPGFDWIGEPGDGILSVKREKKYGYIRTDGSPVTEMRYDEAFSFSDGKALVRRETDSFYIDTTGKRIFD